jgi:hypothetical protein
MFYVDLLLNALISSTLRPDCGLVFDRLCDNAAAFMCRFFAPICFLFPTPARTIHCG